MLKYGMGNRGFFLKVYFEKVNYPNKSKLDWRTASISQIRSRMYLTMKWELLRVAGELNDRRTQLFVWRKYVCYLLRAGIQGVKWIAVKKESRITQAKQGARLPNYTCS